MARINDNFIKLPGSYLFAEIAKRVRTYSEQNPEKTIIRLGIGDVTKPLTPAVIDSLHKSVDEMRDEKTFRGYAPEQGYDFLRTAIAYHDYNLRGINLSADEIFVSDGCKSDCGNIGDIFGLENKVAVCDPVYPVYVDTNAMAGRAGEYIKELGKWSKIIYMPCTEKNNFIPELPAEVPDMIYLCFPNNPTGGVISRGDLKIWVDYALKHGAVILYDSAYEAYITEDYPKSIYEIEGADKCAIEFRSYSKSAGFTGTRCAYTVVPKSVTGKDVNGNDIPLNGLWNRRQSTKFNGVPYIVQRAAEATYTEEGKKEIAYLVNNYLENTKIIRHGLIEAGYTVYGGINSPYVWLKTPKNMTSWQFFDYLLGNAAVVGTPGSGFGPSGEGYFRLTGFGSRDNTIKAIERIKGI